MSLFPIISNFAHNTWFKLNTIHSYLEIGVCEGRSLRFMIEEFPEIRDFVLADSWGSLFGGSNRGSHDHIIDIFIEHNIPLECVTFLDGDSKETVPEYFRLNLSKVFDICFVDGDHSTRGALADLESVVNHCNILAFHDTRHPQHPYLKSIFYSFYELYKDAFYLLDDGDLMGYMIRKDLFF